MHSPAMGVFTSNWYLFKYSMQRMYDALCDAIM